MLNEIDDVESQWTSIVQPSSGWLDINLVEVWRYRHLVWLFAKRDFATVVKQTILGPLWLLIQPIASTLAYAVIFGGIAKIPTDGVPMFLFYMVGTTFWSLFSACVSKTTETFVNNAGLFSKVYFPRLTVPIAQVVTNLFTFTIQILLFFIFLTYYIISGATIQPNLYMLLLPILVLQEVILALGIGLMFASLTTKYRDILYFYGFGLQFLMYATPIVYPLSQISEQWRWLYIFNPMATVVETIRYGFLGAGSVNPYHIIVSIAICITVFFAGVLVFCKAEKSFIDTI